MKYDYKAWTYGAEHEWGDVDQSKGLPEGYGWDRRDITMVNSNGIAVDPKGKSYKFGGEINTPPTKTIKGQVACLVELLEWFPEAAVNHRSNLHIHIRVPGLKDDLESCKKVQRYVADNKGYLDIIEPIPKPDHSKFEGEDEYDGAIRRYKRRMVSHHKTLTNGTYRLQQKATTMEEFYAAEAPKDSKTGKPMFHLAPRCAVNMRQFLETDTIEFRHFPGTLKPELLGNCLRWCRDFLIQALSDNPVPAVQLFEQGGYVFPKFPKYIHWREVGYRMTVHDGTVPRDTIEANIRAILNDPDKALKKTTWTSALPIVNTKAANRRIFMVRGTNGSGKSTVIFNFLKNYGGKPVKFEGAENGIVGYVVKSLNLFIVGPYSTPTGGCDRLKSIDVPMFRAVAAYNRGYNVLLEGLMLSGVVAEPHRLSDGGRRVDHIFLSTPIENCIKRVQGRRTAKGNAEPLDPKHLLSKHRSCISSKKAMEKLGDVTHLMKNSDAYRFILNELGVEDPVEFNPRPTLKAQQPQARTIL
jgi:hypothetical protein